MDLTMVEQVYFAQGEPAKPLLEILDERGPEHLLRSLAAKYHDSGHHEIAAEHVSGPNEDEFEKDDYLLWWSTSNGYVGLDYRIEDVAQQP
jgi:hypothetical protein